MYAPGFIAPPNIDYVGYRAYIDENLPAESPYLYGLHPNAEIGFLTQTSDHMFRTVLEMQPRDTSSASATGETREEKVPLLHFSYTACIEYTGFVSRFEDLHVAVGFTPKQFYVRISYSSSTLYCSVCTV